MIMYCAIQDIRLLALSIYALTINIDTSILRNFK